MSALIRFVVIDLIQHIFTKRWLLIIPVVAVVAYFTTASLHHHKVGGIHTINVWDALFNTFGNPNNIFYCFNPIFLYFVSDFLPESAIGDSMLLRLGSRRIWWAGKVISLSMASLIYILLLVLGSFVLFGSIFQWSDGWSSFAVNNPSDIYIVREITHYHPYFVFLCLLSLLFLGWVSLGVLVLLGILAFKSARWGFSIGLAINLAGLIIHRSESMIRNYFLG